MARTGKYLLAISLLVVAVAMAQVSQKPLPGVDLPNTWTALNNFTGGLQVNGVSVPALSDFRATWGGVTFGTATSGSVVAFQSDKAITITGIGYSLPAGQASGSGCSSQPQIRVSDGITSSSFLTLTNGSASGTLGGLSVNYAAGNTTLRIELGASSGCSIQWGNVNLWAQYKMQ